MEPAKTAIVAAAIHDGHALRPELAERIALSDAERRREEDPFTGRWTRICRWRLVGHQSRFEYDLNRPRDLAIYRSPEECWGLCVWKEPLTESMIAKSLLGYDRFYHRARRLLTRLVSTCGRVVLLDLHSYNHRRDGPNLPPADPEGNPDINVGTGTMERTRWAVVVERFLHDMRRAPFPEHPLDVRENVRFQGGYFPRWVHQTFPDSVCCLAVEVKKIFMDEWTGEPDRGRLAAIEGALRSTLPGLAEEMSSLRRRAI